jgi:hypothetical protein
MNIYQKRWAKVLEYANKLKNLYDTGAYILRFDDEFFDPSETTIIIDEKDQVFSLHWVPVNSDTRVTYTLYEGDLNYDHGAYTKIAITLNEFKERIKLFAIQPIEV